MEHKGQGTRSFFLRIPHLNKCIVGLKMLTWDTNTIHSPPGLERKRKGFSSLDLKWDHNRCSPPLNVHCFSGDDDLGYHDLTQNAEYHFDFCENAVATMFACHFKWNGKDKSFHVYDARHGGSDLCNKGICYYVVANDGFHFSNVYPPNQGRFFCDWNPNTSCSPPLNVHCFSGDDDLGYHDLTQNAEFHFDFSEKPFVTMFACRFKWNGKDKSFHVYDVTRAVERKRKGFSSLDVKWDHNRCSPPLNVHCFSGDDDLGYHDLTQNAEYHFDFCENAVATMFACHFKWNGKDKSFHVYDARHGGSDLCNKGICYYSVANDGFHFSNVYPPNQGRFFCDWNPNTSCN
ncbi:hypothetical protein SASPL_136863 [Salvia splendens]|uniref:S-protein homolog n=1 Tax=Salvia splendens TaxID=180675 RepID=A0A8X8ZH04_SALSN|nr:hypothetical protein SASPL_136863 [Salvia splendens]